MSNILSRIQEIATNEGITIGAMERTIGASKGVLSRAINNGTDIQSKWIQTIVENYPQYSTRWLITGVAPMLCQEKNSPIHLSQSTDSTISIPLVDICVAAGCSGYDNPDYIEAVDSIQMPEIMLKHNAKYFCVRIKGESMSPTILDSSYVIVRLLERQEWSEFPEKHVYVISDKDGRSYIKRVKNRLNQHGFITCMSDNPDKTCYPNFNLQHDEINSILHAEWYMSAKMPNIHETYYSKVSELEDKVDVLQNQMGMIIKANSLMK